MARDEELSGNVASALPSSGAGETTEVLDRSEDADIELVDDGDEGVDGNQEREASAPTNGDVIPDSFYTPAFQKLHPIGWVAIGIGLLAVVASIFDWDLLVARMPLWLWVALAGTVIVSAIPDLLHHIRRGIEAISTAGGAIAMVLAWAIFLLSLFNVITRYTNNLFERDILFGETVSLAWMSFAALFLFGVAAGVKNGINPRIDFWWAEFKPKTKAWLDFVMHTLFLMPFLILGIRVLKPYAAQALGFNPRLNDGEGAWKAGWRVWESWEQSPDAGQLPVGPIKALVIVGFVLWAAQIFAELIKTGYVLAGRHDLGEIKESDAPARVE